MMGGSRPIDMPFRQPRDRDCQSEDIKAHSFAEASTLLFDTHLHSQDLSGYLEQYDKMHNTWSRVYGTLVQGSLELSARPLSPRLNIIALKDVKAIRTIHRCEGGFEIEMKRFRQCYTFRAIGPLPSPLAPLSPGLSPGFSQLSSSSRSSLALSTSPPLSSRSTDFGPTLTQWLFAFHSSVAAVIHDLLRENNGSLPTTAPAMGLDAPSPRPTALNACSLNTLPPGFLSLSMSDAFSSARTPLQTPAHSPPDSSGEEDHDMFGFEGGAPKSTAPPKFQLESASGRFTETLLISPLFALRSCQVGCHSSQGHRNYMEDVCLAIPSLAAHIAPGASGPAPGSPATPQPQCCVLAVFDGHAGDTTAHHASRVIPSLLRPHLHQLASSTPPFSTIFAACEKSIAAALLESDMSGSTAAVCMVFPSHVAVASVGDSRTVLSRNGKALPLSQDHKPVEAEERKRIERAGGWVTIEKELKLGSLQRLKLSDSDVQDAAAALDFEEVGRVNGELGVSRALGDLHLKLPRVNSYYQREFSANLVSSEPEVSLVNLTPEDEFIICATDGLWDVMGSQLAVDLVRHLRQMPGQMNAEHVCEELVHEALRRGSLDNIAVSYASLQ